VFLCGCGVEEGEEFGDEGGWEVVAGEGFADGGEFEEVGERAPVAGQNAAGGEKALRKGGLDEGARGAFVAEEAADIDERRAGDGELPIEDGGDGPAAAILADEDVALAKIAVDEAGVGVEGGELGGARPKQGGKAAANFGSDEALEGGRGETGIDEARDGIGRRRGDARAGAEPAGRGEGDAGNGGEGLADGEGGLRDGGGASAFEFVEGDAVDVVHKEKRRIGRGRSEEDTRNWDGRREKTEEVELLLAQRGIVAVEAEDERGASVEAEKEIGIAQALGEGLDFRDGVGAEGVAEEMVEVGSGEGAGLRGSPAGLREGVEKHGWDYL
jgi:hypothetical protein